MEPGGAPQPTAAAKAERYSAESSASGALSRPEPSPPCRRSGPTTAERHAGLRRRGLQRLRLSRANRRRGSAPDPRRRAPRCRPPPSVTPIPAASAISKAASARPPSDRSCAAATSPARVGASRNSPLRRSAARSTGGASPSSRPEHLGQSSADWPRWPRVSPISERQVAVARQPARSARPSDREQPDAADGGRGQDRLPVGLVVEADVARHDRHVERAAGLADAPDARRRTGP